MISEGFPRFVGREKQIERIRSLLNSNKTLLLLISGDGGIGKSHLLSELCWRLDKGKLDLRSPVRRTQVINLDDTALRVPLNLKQRISEQIDPAAFKKFGEYRVQHIRSQAEKQPIEQIRHIRKQADAAFLDAFNGLAQNGDRMLVLLDTVESVIGTAMWDHFRQDVFPRLENTLIILSGRDLDRTGLHQLNQELSSHEDAIVPKAELMVLPPFTSSETDLYLEAPEVGLQLGSDLQEKLHLLTDGHPILLTLAVEWLRQGLILPKFIDESVEELRKKRLTEQGEELDGVFRQSLVRTTLQLQSPRDKMFLVMAYAHRRMNTELLETLVGEPIPDGLVEELRRLPFIKSKPDQVFVLHDEMQRLLLEYAWPHYDKFGLERRKLDQLLVKYYDKTIAELKRQIGRARQILEAAGEIGAAIEADQIVESFDFLADNESDLWAISAERLFYTLQADLDRGCSYFISEFDGATDAYITYRELLCEEILAFAENLEDVQRYEVELRHARHLRNKGLFSEAYDVASQQKDRVQGDNDRDTELRIFLGSCLYRMPGKLHDAIEVLETARDLAKQTGNESREGQAIGTLGLVMRRAGRWDEAREYYRRAVEICLATEQTLDLAAAFNNLGYVEALRGRYERSLLLIEDALRICEALEDVFMVGVCCSTLGEANRYAVTGYEETMALYDRALNIFEEQRHTEWLSLVYQEKAIAELQLGSPPDLDQAWDLIARSIGLCRSGNPAGLPSALNRAGRIAEARKEPEKAEELLREGVERAKDTDDVWFFIANLVHLAELVYSQNRGSSIERLRSVLSTAEEFGEKVFEYREEGLYKFPDLFGRMDRILGHLKYDLAVGAENAQRLLDEALDHYSAAYPSIAGGFYASHGVRALPSEMEEFRSRIEGLPPETAKAWCERLKSAWGGLIDTPSLPSFVAACTATTQRRLKGRKVHGGQN